MRIRALLASLLLACLPAQSFALPVLILQPGSFVRLSDEINGLTAARFIRDFLSVEGPTVTVFVDSPGGDVLAGLRIIEAVRAAKAARPDLQVHCFVQSAASMAFYFVQLACDERVSGSTSIFMQHQASLGMMGKWGEVQSRVTLVTQVIEWLDQEIAARLGVSVQKYKELIVNDWWLVGQKAVEAKVADRMGAVTCTVDLVKSNQCPLVFIPLPPEAGESSK